jgi:DNA polymerase-1
MPLLPILCAMERTGVKLDADLLRAHSDTLGREMLEIEAKAFEAAGQPFNLNSPKQLGEILFNQIGLKPRKKTPGGAPSTNEDALQELALDHPLPKLILDYRGLAKLKSTYTDKLPGMVNPATGRVHTTYSQAVAVTGRLSSNDPNLQNIPVRTPEGRKIREAFIAPPAFVWSPPTTPRSNYASWPTSPATKACSRPSRRMRTSTPPPPPRSRGYPWSRSPRICGAWPRR